MNLMDISYVDVNELGVRLSNWTDNENDLDFDDISHGYFEKEKLNELLILNPRQKLAINEEDSSMSDEDESNYEIDPETGEKTLRGVIAASLSSSSSSSNDWIEEYLINIASTTNQLIPTTTTTTALLENLPFNNDQTEFNWLAKYTSFEESTTNHMFPDQFLTGHMINDHEKSFSQTMSPVFIPQSKKSTSDSLHNLFGVSTDDEYSISSSSGSSQRCKFLSSFESDSTTHDSDYTFDGSFIETKLEKIEHDEYFFSPMFVRRSSVRSNHQGQQDEDTLRLYNIPLTLYDITQSSTEEYNRHLGRLNHLTAEQLHIIKDIRRRGKNKIAAQNCRKRKAISVETLLEEVDELKRVKHDLEERKKAYQQQIVETRHSYEYLHHQALPDRQLPPTIIVK